MSAFAQFLRRTCFRFDPFCFAFSYFTRLCGGVGIDVLMFPIGVNGRFVITRVDFEPNVRVGVALCTNGAPMVLVFRVMSIARLRGLCNCFVLPLFCVQHGVGLQEYFKVLEMACFFAVRPRVGDEDRSSRVGGGLTFVPVNEGDGDASVETGQTIFRYGR